MPEYSNLDEILGPKKDESSMKEILKEKSESYAKERLQNLEQKKKIEELITQKEELTEQRFNLGVAHLTFARLRMKNIARCNEVSYPFEDWSGTDYSNALMGEVGELFVAFAEVVKHSGSVANLIKKMNRGEGINLSELSEEIADIQIYLDLLAASFNIDIAKEVILRFNEVSNKRGSNIKL